VFRLRPEEEHCLVAGPVGQIELVLARPEKIKSNVCIPGVAAVVCHPHSLHGGSMENKVVTTVVRAMVGVDIPILRFNFRGVGASDGVFDQGVGEQNDLLAVIDWLRGQINFKELWLIGFSFGSFVAASVAGPVGATRCMSLAPAVEHFDFSGIKRANFHWSVLLGDADEIVPPAAVLDWFETIAEPKSLTQFPGAGHFFHGQLLTLRDHLTNWAIKSH